MVLIPPPSSAPRCRMRLFRFTSFFALGHQRHLTLTFHDMLLMLCAVAKRPSQWPWYDRDVCSHHQHDRLPLASPEVLQGFPYQCGISGPTCVAHRVLDLYLRARTASPTQPEVIPVAKSCKTCSIATFVVATARILRSIDRSADVRMFLPLE